MSRLKTGLLIVYNRFMINYYIFDINMNEKWDRLYYPSHF